MSETKLTCSGCGKDLTRVQREADTMLSDTMLSHDDREVWYLYHGWLMDDAGYPMQGQPRAFTSLNDAKEWAASQDFDIEIKAGTRKGDSIVEWRKAGD